MGDQPDSTRPYGLPAWPGGLDSRALADVPHDTSALELALPAREFTVQMPSTRRGAHRARTIAAQQLRCWRLPYDSAAHIVAELAANAALHGRVPGRDFRLTLRVNRTSSVLRIEVTDARPERLPEAPAQGDGAAECGRGLLLVTALADRWGVTAGPVPCKTVWAELDLPG